MLSPVPTDMNSQVLLDNVLLPAAEARVAATGEGFLYGHGVFETLNLRAGRPAFLAEHHARLCASAHDLDLPYSVSLEELRRRLCRVASANGIVDGSAKIVLFNNGDTTGELVTARSFVYPPEAYERGFSLRTVFTGERTGSLSSHKTLNYLANIRAKRAAQAARFDEPLFLTPAGIVIEGATTNVFAVRRGVARTPALASGPLPGIARAVVLSRLGPDRSREDLLTRADLDEAEEVFVTNSLLGVMPVTRIDDRMLPVGPLSREMSAVFLRLELASLS